MKIKPEQWANIAGLTLAILILAAMIIGLFSLKWQLGVIGLAVLGYFTLRVILQEVLTCAFYRAASHALAGDEKIETSANVVSFVLSFLVAGSVIVAMIYSLLS